MTKKRKCYSKGIMMIIWSHGETKKKDSLIFLPGSDGITYYTVMPAAPFCLVSPTHDAGEKRSSFYERGRNSKFVFTSHEKRRTEDHKLNISFQNLSLFLSKKLQLFKMCFCRNFIVQNGFDSVFLVPSSQKVSFSSIMFS